MFPAGGSPAKRLVGAFGSAVLLLLLTAVPARAAVAGPAGWWVARVAPEVGDVGPPRASYALASTTLGDGRRALLRWNPCQVITYRINVDRVPADSRTAVAAEIRGAVAGLSSATGISYRYAGTTSVVPRTANVAGQDAELVVAVTTPEETDFPIGEGMLGYGGYRYWEWSQSSGGRTRSDVAIARAWVVVDVRGVMALRGGFGAGATRGNVFLHELAHTVGLEHTDDPHQLLYPELGPGAPDGYASGDRNGLVRVGRAGGCIDIPANVIADLR